MKKKFRYLVGVDEVGRGPLAGPVAVCAFAMPEKEARGFLRLFFRHGIRDSKQLSPEERMRIYKEIRTRREIGILDFKVSYSSHTIIDRKGISHSVKKAVKSSLWRLNLNPEECRVLLDGSLKAPDEFIFQETIIGGDAKEAIIALASITAKVLRDRKMANLARKYPNYGFEIHKGYGTKFHYENLKKFGISPIHRLSFLTKFVSDYKLKEDKLIQVFKTLPGKLGAKPKISKKGSL